MSFGLGSVSFVRISHDMVKRFSKGFLIRCMVFANNRYCITGICLHLSAWIYKFKVAQISSSRAVKWNFKHSKIKLIKSFVSLCLARELFVQQRYIVVKLSKVKVACDRLSKVVFACKVPDFLVVSLVHGTIGQLGKTGKFKLSRLLEEKEDISMETCRA